MKKTIAILLVAILAVGSAFAALTGSAQVGLSTTATVLTSISYLPPIPVKQQAKATSMHLSRVL